MSSPMTPIVQVGHQPHPISRKKYGQPYVGLYAAGSRFETPGIYIVVLRWSRRIPWTQRLAERLDD